AAEGGARRGAGGRTRVAIEVHSDDARGAVRVLERLRERIVAGAADAGVLVREADAPIGNRAKRTEELVRSLEPAGGIVWIERDAARQLVASELLLDAVAAGDVMAEGRSLGRDEAVAYLLEQEDAGVLARVVSRVAPVEGREPPAARKLAT